MFTRHKIYVLLIYAKKKHQIFSRILAYSEIPFLNYIFLKSIQCYKFVSKEFINNKKTLFILSLHVDVEQQYAS